MPKALARGERLERGAGVGDGDKAITRIIAPRGLDFCAEVAVEAERFDSGARLGGDHKEGFGWVDATLDGLDRTGLRRVEHEEARPTALWTE